MPDEDYKDLSYYKDLNSSIEGLALRIDKMDQKLSSRTRSNWIDTLPKESNMRKFILDAIKHGLLKECYEDGRVTGYIPTKDCFLYGNKDKGYVGWNDIRNKYKLSDTNICQTERLLNNRKNKYIDGNDLYKRWFSTHQHKKE